MSKHAKVVHMEMEGQSVTNATTLYEAFNKGVFPYQFARPDGSRSRVMRCSSLDELLWLTEQVTGGNPVIIGASTQT